MTYLTKSVPKPQKRSAGAPSPKEPNLTLVKTSDILAWPAIGPGGVQLSGNYVLKPGATMIQVYVTASKISATGEAEGDEDAEGTLQKYEASHPGTSVEIREFVMAATGEDWILIQGNCHEANKTVYGSACAPMKLKPAYTDNNDGSMYNINFEQYIRTIQQPFNYTGSLFLENPFKVADENISLLKANGLNYQLAASNLADTILDIAALDLDHGDVVSLIGGGGDEPSTLSSGAATGAAAVTVITKEDSDWIALQNATIAFEVFKAGAITYLIERNRTA